MARKDHPAPEERIGTQFIQSLHSMYNSHAQNARDLAEVRMRLQEAMFRRSTSYVYSALPEDDNLMDAKAESTDIHYQMVKIPGVSEEWKRRLLRGAGAFAHHRRTWVRVCASLAAILLMLSLVLGGIVLIPQLRLSIGRVVQTTPSAHLPQSTPIIQLPQTIQVSKQTEAGTFLTKDLGSAYLPAWTPDSKYLSFVDSKGNAYVWDVAKNTLTKTISLPGSVNPNPTATWSRAPGGRYLLSFSRHAATYQTIMQVWDVLTGQKLLSGIIGCFGWSADGTHLAVSNNNILQLWDLATRAPALSIPTGEGCPISWSPDGTRLLMPSLNGQGVSIIDTTTGLIPWRKNLPPGTTGFIDAWSPNGQRLAILVSTQANSENTSQQIWDVSTGRQLSTTNQRGVAGEALWSQDSVHLLSVTDQEVAVWDTVTRQTILHLSNPAGSYTRYRGPSVLSPNGKLFELDDGGSDVQIWDIEAGQRVSTYRSSADIIKGAISWSPDSQDIVSAEVDGTVNVWNVATGHIFHSYTIPWGQYNPLFYAETSLAWSPNGKFIAIVSDRSIAAVVASPLI